MDWNGVFAVVKFTAAARDYNNIFVRGLGEEIWNAALERNLVVQLQNTKDLF
jgi:hypothetical protein